MGERTFTVGSPILITYKTKYCRTTTPRITANKGHNHKSQVAKVQLLFGMCKKICDKSVTF